MKLIIIKLWLLIGICFPDYGFELVRESLPYEFKLFLEYVQHHKNRTFKNHVFDKLKAVQPYLKKINQDHTNFLIKSEIIKALLQNNLIENAKPLNPKMVAQGQKNIITWNHLSAFPKWVKDVLLQDAKRRPAQARY